MLEKSSCFSFKGKYIIFCSELALPHPHDWSSLLIPADGREGLFWEAAMWWTLSAVFSPASLLFRQAKLFYAAVDVNSLLRCLCLFFSRNSRAWIKSQRSKSSCWSRWNTDKEMKSRREERVKLVIFLAHGCNYTPCIPEAFLWILCRSACLSWERGRKREEKSLFLGDGMSAFSILFLGRSAFLVLFSIFNQTFMCLCCMTEIHFWWARERDL